MPQISWLNNYIIHQCIFSKLVYCVVDISLEQIGFKMSLKRGPPHSLSRSSVIDRRREKIQETRLASIEASRLSAAVDAPRPQHLWADYHDRDCPAKPAYSCHRNSRHICASVFRLIAGFLLSREELYAKEGPF